MKRKRSNRNQNDGEPPNKKRKQNDNVLEEPSEFLREMDQLENFEKEHGMTERTMASHLRTNETAHYRKYEEVRPDNPRLPFQRHPSPPPFPPPPSRHETKEEKETHRRYDHHRGKRKSSSTSSGTVPPPPPPIQPVTIKYDEFRPSLMTRNYILSLLDKPYITEVLEDTFVRYCHGQDQYQQNVYRIGLIVGVTKWNKKGEVYKVNGIPTDRCLQLRVPFEENFRKQRIDHVSNSLILEAEFFELVNENCDPYTRKRLNKEFIRIKLDSIQSIESSYHQNLEEQKLFRNISEKRFEELPNRKLNEIYMELKIKQKIHIQETRKINPQIQQEMDRINTVIKSRNSGDGSGRVVHKNGRIGRKETAMERISRRNKEKNLESFNKKKKNQRENPNHQQDEDSILNQEDKLIFQRKHTRSRFFTFGVDQEKKLSDEDVLLVVDEKRKNGNGNKNSLIQKNNNNNNNSNNNHHHHRQNGKSTRKDEHDNKAVGGDKNRSSRAENGGNNGTSKKKKKVEEEEQNLKELHDFDISGLDLMLDDVNIEL